MDHTLRGACASGNIEIIDHILMLFDNLMPEDPKFTDMVLVTPLIHETAMLGALMGSMCRSSSMPLDKILGRDFYIQGCVSAIVHNHLHIFVHVLNRLVSITST